MDAAIRWVGPGALLLVLGTGGCASLLPGGEAVVQGPWQSYDDAQSTFDGIVPYQTRAGDLQALRLDARSNPNITLLNYSDVLQRFIPRPAVDAGGVDSGVRDCLLAKTGCVGYEINQKVTNRKRQGGFWLDFLNFKRETDVTGWRFNGVLLIVDDLVVYKLTGGQPVIHEVEQAYNPLGPLQGIGESTGRLVR